MATFERSASIDWQGTVREGKGEIQAKSGAFSLPVTFPARVEKSDGKTSPEELIAAAHAACYAMALAATLGRKNARAGHLRVTATVGAEFGEAGLTIRSSRLEATAEALEGLPKDKFVEAAREAEGRCPVSNALRANVKIELVANAK